MSKPRVLICGGRYFGSTEAEMMAFIDALNYVRPKLIVNGGASGADELSTVYARFKGIPYRVYTAEWDKYGKSAGPRRNALMLEKESIDLVLAFPGGRGTADMVKKAKEANIKVIDFHEYFDEYYRALSGDYHK